MKVYLDSCIVIYLVEQVEDFTSRLQNLILEDAVFLISDLTRMECRIKPLQDKNTALLEEYDFFFSVCTRTIPLDAEVFDKAAEIRAEYPFKTPDALHLSCAISCNADIFLTNDRRLSSFSEISVKVL